MSTKSTLKSRLRVGSQPGFHLYEDMLNELAEEPATAGDCESEPPVYLVLEGIEAKLHTLSSGGAEVTLTLPRQLARELGLVA